MLRCPSQVLGPPAPQCKARVSTVWVVNSTFAIAATRAIAIHFRIAAGGWAWTVPTSPIALRCGALVVIH
eukprot:4894374-Pyramimonas_sp.AAC.1